MLKALRPLIVALLVLSYFAVPTFARRAITVTEKMTGGFGGGAGSTSNSSGYTSSDTFAIASDAIGLCFVHNTDTGTAGDIADEGSFTHTAVSWTSIATQTYTANQTGRITAYWKAGAISSGAVSVSFSDNQTGAAMSCFEVAGADLASPVLQSNSTTTTSTTTHDLTVSARTANSVLFSVVAVQEAETWTAEYASVGAEITYSSPGTEFISQWVIDGSDATPRWVSGTNATTGLFAVEIAEAAVGGGAPPRRGLLLHIGGK